MSAVMPSLPDRLGALALAQAAMAPPTPGRWSEWRESADPGDGTPGLRWRQFFAQLGAEGWADLAARERRVQQRVREDGATYNVYAEPSAPDRAWPLQLLPVILQPEEWAVIEHGVRQRTQMLESVLDDLYGERRLLRDALLPASLVFAHPDYLRPMHGVRPAGGTRLHVAAFDLARTPAGSWCVLGQRLQAPSGLGYLLENRLIVRAEFGEAFAAMQVQRLAASFRRLLDALLMSCPAGARGRVVLLTPGPLNETYFEQVFLARYLGVTLVEGGDLTVRGQTLYLKTLHGLEPVHVVLRRVDDAWLDPLELRADSALGVPGLMQAVRAGEVVMANAPGAGVLESPGLAAFWPAVAERLLGQDLLLPAAAAWWCGEGSVWAGQRESLADWVVAPTFPDSGFAPVEAGLLDAAARDALAARIDADPAAYTLQAPVRPGETPVWREGRLEQRASVLRVYALADGQGSWHVMPGALARVAGAGSSGHDPWLSMQRGSASADTWVVAHEAVEAGSMLPRPLTSAELAGLHRTVTSRSADNLFWLGRYTERAEHTVRLARAVLDALPDAAVPVLQWLDGLARTQGLVAAPVPPAWRLPRVFERSLLTSLGDVRGAASVAYNLQCLRHCAQALRERLSQEHWQLIHEVGDHFSQHWRDVLAAGEGHAAAPELQALLARAATHLAAITGAQTDRMTRDDGWRLLSVGRQIERLDTLASALERAVAFRVHEAEDGMGHLLGLFDSLITYRAQFQGRRELMPMLHLLVLDTDNPRSLAWVARTMRDRLRKLARPHVQWVAEVSALAPVPEHWSLDELARPGAAGDHPTLVAALRQCSTAARRLSDEIHRRLFVHGESRERRVWQ